MTNRQPTSAAGWWRFFLAAAVAVLVGLLGAGSASAATLPELGNRVGASTPAVAHVVGIHECISAGQRWGHAPPQAETVAGFCVAAKSAPRLGAPFGGDKAIANMSKWAARNPEPGYYDVIGHGGPNSLAGMSADELAAKIGSSSGGQNIRLLACQTGCPTGSFAQDLSNRLGVRVMAPTTDIGASDSGKTLTVFDGGGWRWFDPN